MSSAATCNVSYVQPYLFFDGKTDEALEFYKNTLGAKVQMLMRFNEHPESSDDMPPGNGDKVMHCSFSVGSTLIMASDGMCMGKAQFQGISLSLTVPTAEEADRLFAALGEGGQIQMPISKTFFSPRFGMVADKFGVSWMVVVES